MTRPEPPTLPAVHALHLAELVARWRVEPAELLAPLGLDRERLSDPEGRLPLAHFEALVARARALTGEPGLGIYAGLQMRISYHGYLGFAAMTASTVREALELAMRFSPIRTNALSLRLRVDGPRAALLLEEHADFGTARDAVLIALLVGIWQMGMALTGQPLSGGADLRVDEPPWFARFAALTPGPVRFGQPANQLLFDASALELPLRMADPVAMRLAREQCERLLDGLGYDGDLVARVRAQLPRREAGFRSLEETARAVGVSGRTLKRKLAARGTTFAALLEEARRERAMLLLRSAELSLLEVADRLGYSDLANFTRAFRRWTGRTPGAYRRQL